MFTKIFKISINLLLGCLIALGIFVIFSFVPIPGNYKLYTVQSGSMEPAIHTGSLIFVKPMADYSVGDVVTRTTSDPKVTITHRIVDKAEKDGQMVFHTRGDANNAADAEDVPGKNVIGKEIFVIPYLGFPVSYAKTTPGLILLIVIPSVIIIYDEAQKIKKEILLKMEYRKRVKKRAENKDKEEEKEKDEEKV
jgi:signal peptidase I